ncbi:hypothetical protein TWF106_003393 [Orbilia oligospora]|uniref:Uncharacterized protein n=2 Tax=Orbilia oligospora TaxID=2813651 RepID=A0A7C8U5H5_ORBOL|nr:hypothetical protein TWF106_003393 [Orbilia oligospora]
MPSPPSPPSPSAEPSMAATPTPSVQIPPLSFALVSTGVYRSGCPMPLNFPFLSKLHLKSIIYLADQDLPTDLQRFVAENNIQVFHFRVQQVRGDNNATDDNADESLLENGLDTASEIVNEDGSTAISRRGSAISRRGSAAAMIFEEERERKEKKEKEKEKVENDPVSMRLALELLLDNRNFPVLIHSNKGKHRSGVLVACMRKLLQNWAFGSVKLEYYYFAGEKGKADVEFIEKFEPTLKYDERWAPAWLRYAPEEGKLIKVIKDG